MNKNSTDDTTDLQINLIILAINALMLYVLLTTNTSFNSMSIWAIAINRVLIVGNLAFVILSFYWIYNKRIELQKTINEILITPEKKDDVTFVLLKKEN